MVAHMDDRVIDPVGVWLCACACACEEAWWQSYIILPIELICYSDKEFRLLISPLLLEPSTPFSPLLPASLLVFCFFLPYASLCVFISNSLHIIFLMYQSIPLLPSCLLISLSLSLSGNMGESWTTQPWDLSSALFTGSTVKLSMWTVR